MKMTELFLQTQEGKALPKEYLPLIEPMFGMYQQAYNQGVDAALELVRKYGDVKQLSTQEDFRTLLEFIEKMKDSQ